jgi:PKD repeat protein
MEEDRAAKHGAEKEEEFEEWLQRRTQTARGLRKKSIGIYTLPVVIHVIYSNPTENISKEQVLSQLQVLNQDYRRTNPDKISTPAEFQRVAADCQIDFCLASVDPQGQPTDGIDRISISGSPFKDKFINDVIKPNTIWDPNRYMNIWVINISDGILGYAQFPLSSGLTGIPTGPTGETTDGVVIHYNAFGTMGTASAPFNRGRTATHEVGHWLGLRHVWGDGPCTVDDYCGDTPPTGEPSFGCQSGKRGCFGQAMIQNFMDYSDDVCMNLFTYDQKARMRAVLENSPRRASLLRSNVCSEQGAPPIASFTADIQLGCGPLIVNFEQLCQGDPTRFIWSFPGGSPASSSAPNPQVVYNQPGEYAVSLVAENAFGRSPAFIQEGYIKVTTEGANMPLVATFETKEVPPDSFFMYNPGGEGAWEHTQRVSGRGTSSGCFMFNNFENNLIGGSDWLITPIMDLSDNKKSVLTFDLAYAAYNNKYSDTLGIFISTGCDSRFKAIYFQGGNDLATAQAGGNAFTPFPEEWRTERIDLSEYDGEPFVQLAFVNISGYGNNLYLDNVKLAGKMEPVPRPDFVAQEVSVCAGKKIKFKDLSKGEITDIAWTFPGGIPASSKEANPEILYAEAGIYDVILTVTNASGSKTETKSRLITVNAGPDMKIENEVVNICEGGNATLNASGAQSYLWAPRKGLDRTIGPEVFASPDVTTTYTVTGSGARGCASIKTVTVQVNQPSSFTIDPPFATVCNGESVVLTASGAGTYKWVPAEGLSNKTGPIVTAKPSRTTTYTVIGSNEGGCEFSRTITVKVEEVPPVYVKAEKTEICPGEAVRIRATGSDDYRWVSSTGREAYEGEEIVVSPDQTTTYTVSTGSVGCSSVAEVTIEAKTKPSVQASQGEYLICAGTTEDLVVSGASSFRWLPAEGLPITRGSVVPVNPRRSTIYKVIGSNVDGCTDTLSIKVKVPPPTELKVSVSHPTLCPGMRAQIKAEGASSYQWFPRSGLNRSYGSTVEARPSGSTTYTLRAEDKFGCIIRKDVQINVATNQAPVAGFTMEDQQACVGESVKFKDKSINATTYYWEFPGGMPTRSSEQNPQITYYLPGTYDVILRVVGCNGKDEIVRRNFITVNRGTPVRVIDSVKTICQGEKVQLEAEGAVLYRWSPRVGLTGMTGSRIIAEPDQDITYKVTGTDASGCKSEANIRIAVKGSGKKGRIISKTTSICSGEEVKLMAGGASEYIWLDDDDRKVGEGTELNIKPTQSGSYVLEARDAFGCVTEDETFIEVKAAPNIKLLATANNVCVGDQVEMEASGGFNYQWLPQGDFVDINESKKIIRPRESTTYKVIGTDGFGCKGEAELRINVNRGEALFVSPTSAEICAGQSISIEASGGDNYRWEPVEGLNITSGNLVEASPAQTTTYTVSSDNAGGCPATASVTIKVGDAKPLKVTPPTQSVCAGELVELQASGSEIYRWDPTEGLTEVAGSHAFVRPNKTTTFTVRSTSPEGCLMEGSATIEVKTTEGLEMTASASSICAGEEITLKLEKGKPEQWLQAEGLHPNASGPQAAARPRESTTYRIVGRDASGCLDTASIRVNVRTLTADFTSSIQEIDLAAQDGFTTFTDRTEGEASQWEWDFGDGGTSVQQNPTHIYTKEGNYEVLMLVSDGICIGEKTRTIRVVNNSDLEEILDESGIRVFPARTTTGEITISIETERDMLLKFRMLDDEGTTILSDFLVLEEGKFEQTLDLSFFDKGKYTLQITDGEGTYNKTIVYE